MVHAVRLGGEVHQIAVEDPGARKRHCLSLTGWALKYKLNESRRDMKPTIRRIGFYILILVIVLILLAVPIWLGLGPVVHSQVA